MGFLLELLHCSQLCTPAAGVCSFLFGACKHAGVSQSEQPARFYVWRQSRRGTERDTAGGCDSPRSLTAQHPCWYDADLQDSKNRGHKSAAASMCREPYDKVQSAIQHAPVTGRLLTTAHTYLIPSCAGLRTSSRWASGQDLDERLWRLRKLRREPVAVICWPVAGSK